MTAPARCFCNRLAAEGSPFCHTHTDSHRAAFEGAQRLYGPGLRDLRQKPEDKPEGK